MSTATARAYRSRFAGRIATLRSRKSPEIKAFCGHRSTYSGMAHCIKDRVLLDIILQSLIQGRGIIEKCAFAVYVFAWGISL